MGFGAPTTPGGGTYIRPATLVIAASDSRDPTNVDYRCDGTDDQVEINNAIGALPAGGGMVTLLEGTYSITASINLPSNVALVGQGAGSVLRIPDNYNANINVISASNVSNILIENLRIDGNRANQTAGTMHGIYFFDTVTHSKVVNCWAENLRNFGIYLTLSNDYNTIDSNTCQGNGLYGILLYASSNHNTVTGNTCQGNGALGIVLEASSNYNTVTGNTCQGNATLGIRLRNSTHNTITGNTCQGNSQHGILLYASRNNTVTGNTCQENGSLGIYLEDLSNYNTVTGNTCQGNATQGIRLTSSDYNTIVGNTCQGNGAEGIYLFISDHNTIEGNTIAGNSQTADDTYDGIFVDDNSDYNNVQGNTVRHLGGANQHRYGIRINTADCDGNLVINNDLYLAGRTANFSDAGTGTTQDVVKEVFLPAYGHTDGARSALGYYSAVTFADAGSFACYFTLKVPRDFASFVRVEAVWSCAAAAGDMHWGLGADYGASGELYNVHSDSPLTGETATGGANIINVQQPANPLTLANLARGDYVGIWFTRDGTAPPDTLNADVHLLGLLFTYRTDE